MTIRYLDSGRYAMDVNGTPLPILIRKHATSRRITIRYQPLKSSLALTLPRYVSIKQGLRFVEEKQDWIVQQMQRQGGQIALVGGQEIPVLGHRLSLRHEPGRGVARIEGDRLIVPGEERFMGRRVRDFLVKETKGQITRLAQEKAAVLGKKIRRISLRDTGSHWGSCSHSGSLSFSWRLVFAPLSVLDYIVAHEVAHLVELNHSKAFWAVVARLCPDYKAQAAWLKAHGSELYRYH